MSYTVQPGLTLYFIRHGQTDWNRQGRFQGRVDKPLNDIGRAQAARNGQVLKQQLNDLVGDFDFLASPLQRARETMKIVREQMALPPDSFRTDDRLLEISFGKWEGHTLDEIESLTPKSNAARLEDKWAAVPPSGESYEMVYHRVGGWLQTLTRDSIIVSHGGVMRAYCLLLDPELDPQEVPHMEVPQDKVLSFRDGTFNWL